MSKRVQSELMLNIEEGNFERVCNMITRENIEERNQTGYTPLALAVRTGHYKIVEELVKKGADINATNDAGQSILFIACWHNHEEIVKLLLSRGVKVNQPDQRGWTPLIISVYHNYAGIVELLLQAGSDIDHQDSFGKNAIDRAKNVEMISMIRKYSEERKIGQKVSLSLPGTPGGVSHLDNIIRPKSRDNSIDRKSESSQKSSNSPYKFDNMKSPQGREPTPTKQKVDQSFDRNIGRTSFENEKLYDMVKEIEENIAERFFNDMDITINDQLNQAIDVLQKEIETLVNRSTRDLFRKLKEYVFRVTDNLLGKSNYKISNSRIQADFSEIFEFREQLINVSSTHRSQYAEEIGKLGHNQLKLGDRRIDDIKEDLYRHVNNYLSELDSKMKELSGNHISKEISNRIFTVKDTINSEINHYLLYLTDKMKSMLDDLVAARIKEICDDNRISLPRQMNKNNSAGNLPGGRPSATESYKNEAHRSEKSESQRKSHDFSNDYLENLSQEYTKYQTPQYSSTFQIDFPESSQSFSKEPPKSKPPVSRPKASSLSSKGDQKQVLPPTNVSSTLQGFLKFEEMSRK
ncbi:unnamed protein product [Blepharisma stoltei]|uniref:Uncharacterized protein n=1 Tax=Blepharisma stoltei TaxID=1481888 RepID=A0AAU9K8Z8_9CILI|nr:unnamed protein product [Blepharisma stoltei]